jgi:hypothetical protein
MPFTNDVSEHDHAQQLRRRAIVVPKAKYMVHASIALCARLGGNDKVRCLLPMIA